MSRAGELAKLVAKEFEHGTRARYVAQRCRCEECRAANTQYARDCAARAKARALENAGGAPVVAAPQTWTAPDGSKRVRLYRRACAGINGKPCPTSSHLRKDSTGDICGQCRITRSFNGLVSTDRARAHLLELQAAGVGKLSVADACDVPKSLLHDVRSGRALRIRVETERRILEVDAGAIADHATVPANTTWRLLGELLAIGIPKYKLARALGSKAARCMPALQIGRDRVLAKTEQRIVRFHREFAAELLRETELREVFEGAAERGAEFFDHTAYSRFSRASAIPKAAA